MKRVKILILIIIVLLITIGCSSTSIIEKRICTSEYPVVYKKIQEIINNPNLLLEMNTKNGSCSDVFSFTFNKKLINEFYKLSTYQNNIEIVEEGIFYAPTAREFLTNSDSGYAEEKYFAITMKLKNETNGVSLCFNYFADSWCLDYIIYYNPSTMSD